MEIFTTMKKIPDIQAFYDHPYVMANEWEDLVIFSYSRECQYDKKWDDVTRAARGIIFNKKTGELLARPFEKFFNLGEMPESSFENLPDGPFTTTEKMDGSLGILFFHGRPHVATKGSFKSEQAHWATEWIRKKDLYLTKDEYTYLFEVIYKDNKIVIDYGEFEGLVLLACVNKETGLEMPYEQLVEEADAIGVPVVRRETGFLNIEKLYHYCKALPYNKEGFVVTFSNGLKVKIKGDEYCKIHKIISRMTPLAFWEAWDRGTQQIPKDFLAQVPEEFRETSDDLSERVHRLHMEPAERAWKALEELLKEFGEDADDKTLALAVRDRYKKILPLIMDWHKGKVDNFWKNIHQWVRPTYNILPGDVKGAERLRRIASES